MSKGLGTILAWLFLAWEAYGQVSHGNLRESYCSKPTNWSGYEFFSQNNSRFILTNRTYTPAGGFNQSLCMRTGYTIFYHTDYVIERNFQYKNLSEDQTDLKWWPYAWVNMTFYHGRRATPNRTSSTQDRSEGYHIPAAKWKFVYTRKNCAVIQVLTDETKLLRSHKRNNRPIQKCELWKRQIRRNDTKIRLPKGTCCEEYFKTKCNISVNYNAHRPDLCGSD
ncbi:uncharacterized protein LOC144169159 [Haemaphysalis longicornis]